jgi:hypothetical protein
MLVVRVLTAIAVIFDILIAISIPLVPGIKFYIVGIDFVNTTIVDSASTPTGSNITASLFLPSFNGQVNSAGKSISVQIWYNFR